MRGVRDLRVGRRAPDGHLEAHPRRAVRPRQRAAVIGGRASADVEHRLVLVGEEGGVGRDGVVDPQRARDERGVRGHEVGDDDVRRVVAARVRGVDRVCERVARLDVAAVVVRDGLHELHVGREKLGGERHGAGEVRLAAGREADDRARVVVGEYAVGAHEDRVEAELVDEVRVLVRERRAVVGDRAVEEVVGRVGGVAQRRAVELRAVAGRAGVALIGDEAELPCARGRSAASGSPRPGC